MGPQITVLIQGSTSQSSSTKDRILAWLEEEDASSGPHQVRIAFKGQSIGAPQDKYNQYLDHLKQEKGKSGFHTMKREKSFGWILWSMWSASIPLFKDLDV